jgi:hypothetical protein
MRDLFHATLGIVFGCVVCYIIKRIRRVLSDPHPPTAVPPPQHIATLCMGEDFSDEAISAFWQTAEPTFVD